VAVAGHGELEQGQNDSRGSQGHVWGSSGATLFAGCDIGALTMGNKGCAQIEVERVVAETRVGNASSGGISA
jgi:hypothetical protein